MGWRREPVRVTRTVLYWAALVVGPLALAGIELFHPAGFTDDPGAFQYLTNPDLFDGDFNALAYPGPDWWFTLHMIQTPMVVLTAAGMLLLVAGLATLPALVARVALFVFAVYYTALDAIGGVGLGRTLIAANDACQPVPAGDWVECSPGSAWSTADYNAVRDSVNGLWTDSWVGGVGSFVSQTGSWAAFASFALVAIALVESGRSRLAPAAVMAVSGWYLQLSHAAFNGPIAFGLLAVAGTWMWFGRPGDEGAPSQRWFPEPAAVAR